MYKKILWCMLLSFGIHVCAHHRNLVIIVDTIHQETINSYDVTMTHQAVVALQQQASAVLISTSIWKNIVKRKKSFEQRLQDPASAASHLLRLYDTTNKMLKDAKYTIYTVNKSLDKAWFDREFPVLAALDQDEYDQLRFDFFCYHAILDFSAWAVYDAHAGMLLFVPLALAYQVPKKYRIEHEQDLYAVADKKSNVVQSCEKLLHQNDQWVIYLTGHGSPKDGHQKAYIAGQKSQDFKKFLLFCHEQLSVKLLVYSSCFGGGVHTIEPYENLQLSYPVIVTSLTDAPIFGFGLFEGVKLPPYDDQFKLEVGDVAKLHGLQHSIIQNYHTFFKRAWKGLYDLHLVQAISPFFSCDFMQCYVQKIENYPLLRRPFATFFTPLKDGNLFRLVQVVNHNTTIYATKPVLVYTKKVKKIKMDHAVPLISMLPGNVSYEITELWAPKCTLTSLLSQSFFSLQDRKAYKNCKIKTLICQHDLQPFGPGEYKLSNVLIIDHEKFLPRFVDKQVQAVMYFQYAGQAYLMTWHHNTIKDCILLSSEQIEIMKHIDVCIQASIDYQAKESYKLVTFDLYQEHKKHEQELLDACVKVKACKR